MHLRNPRRPGTGSRLRSTLLTPLSAAVALAIAAPAFGVAAQAEESPRGAATTPTAAASADLLGLGNALGNLPVVSTLGSVSELPGAADGIDYVALGDSYSAGPLVPAIRLDPLGCIRSTNNYPAFLADHLDVKSYVDVTCSGAETADIDQRQQETIIPGPPPPLQLDALSAETDLVTVGIGGNDYGLFGQMISTCGKAAEIDSEGSPCRKLFTEDGVDTKLRDAARIEADVTRVLVAIRERAPHAAVYVVGYPRLLPEFGHCDAVGFAKGDYAWGNRIERRLNRSLENAAASTGNSYIDLYPASRGHDACAGTEAWINGKTLKPLRAANFHPFLRGMRGIGQEVYRVVSGGKTATGGPIALPPIGIPTLPSTSAKTKAPKIARQWKAWERSQ